MTRRAARFALVLILTAGLAGAGWMVVDIDRRAGERRAAFDALDVSAHRVLSALGSLRGGLQAYVAPGQGDEYWRRRVDEATRLLTEELSSLRQLAHEGAALNDLDAASAALDTLNSVNERVTALVRNDQRTLASPLVFGEGLEALTTAGTRINTAWSTERTAAEGRDRQDRATLVLVMGGSAGLAFLVALLLLVISAAPALAPGAGAPAIPADEGATGAGDAATLPVLAEPTPESPQAVPAADAGSAEGPGDFPRDRRKATELKAMADLCTDFARLLDSQELPALLERAAHLLDAHGFVIWMADPAGRELRPALAHGYTPQTLARLPTIERQADNATATAWRLAEMQVVKTNGMTPGALVVPILAPVGCIGVLSAELRHGRESSESIRALARIVAAQIATLVSVPATETGAGALAPAAADGSLG